MAANINLSPNSVRRLHCTVNTPSIPSSSVVPNFAKPANRDTSQVTRKQPLSHVKRIPDGKVLRRDNQWGIPRNRALFVSDGPDSTTSGSDILEGHYDRPPEEGYSDVHSTGRPHDVHVAEELCSPSEHLEKAVVRLQQDIADYHAELELNRTQDSGGLYSASETVGVYVDVSS